jgi:hypothetical protein
MPDLDDELLERVARWCAEAGRTTAAGEVRRALGGLSWDELLAVKAILADPPPGKPLGPFALADLARGVPADAAADRERKGRYPHPDDATEPPSVVAAAAAAPARAPRKGSKRKSVGPVIRRARDAAAPQPPPSPTRPLIDELFLPEGRAALERMVRRLGASRHALVAALAEGWRTADGRPVDDDALSRLLDHHGLARAFERREHDELLHALRASAGLRAAAAARLGLDRAAFDAALDRAGARDDAERIREARRAEVRAKATLAERVRLLLAEPARLEDLGMLDEIEADLRRRLPEHVRAVGAGGGPLLIALARSLSIAPPEAQALADRLGVLLDGGRPIGQGPLRARQRPPAPRGATSGLRTPRRTTGGLRTPRRTTGGAPGPAARGGPPAPGRFGGAGRRGPGPGGRAPLRPRPDRDASRSGPPHDARGKRDGGFGSPRPPGRKAPGPRPAGEGRDWPAGTTGAPRRPRGASPGAPGGQRRPTGGGGSGPGARPGRPGRPGGGERPPRKGPRR